ncbi:MAG: hypothetical protein V1788_03520 [Nanoarchaeota archaeon]
MRFSRFSHIYEICDSKNNFYYLIRHSILNYSYLLRNDEFNILLENIKNRNLKEIKELIKNHLIVPNDYSEKAFLKYLQLKNNKFF